MLNYHCTVKNFEHFNIEDTKRIRHLIDIQKDSFAFENIVLRFVLIFLMIIAVGISFIKLNFLPHTLAFTTLPIAGILYNNWKLNKLTADLRTDLSERRKYSASGRINILDTRTDAWTVQSGPSRFKTIQKSFDYFIKVGEFTFITKDKDLYESLKLNDLVALEIAKNSHFVLDLRKTQHNIA